MILREDLLKLIFHQPTSPLLSYVVLQWQLTHSVFANRLTGQHVLQKNKNWNKKLSTQKGKEGL